MGLGKWGLGPRLLMEGALCQRVEAKPQHIIFFFQFFYSLIPKMIPYYSCNKSFLPVPTPVSSLEAALN